MSCLDMSKVQKTATRGRVWLVIAVLVSILAIFIVFAISKSTPHCDSVSQPDMPASANESVALSRLLLSDSLTEYRRYLEEYYSDNYPLYSRPVFSINNRPERPINLVLVLKDKNESDSSTIQLQELFSNGSADKIQEQKKMNEIGLLNGKIKLAKFVLIEGGPGMGKSTLCWQLCGLWREGKLQWDLMVIVELRDESTRRASSLYNLLYHPDDETRLAIEQDIKKREGEGLLIFLDGYDELSNEQQHELSVVHKLLTNKLLRKATVVVTSRPHATASLPSQFKQALNQHIKIAGFNETDIQTYITSACRDDQQLLENFRSYVDSHPFILLVMYNPLHCSIVTELYIQYWQSQKVFAPQTLTELYYAFLLNLLRHNLPSNKHSIVTNDLSDLPKSVYTNLMQLAELAARGLENRQYIFTNNDISCDTLGLMVSVRKLYDIRAKQKHHYIFLHLTLQEYLAALYWYRYPDKQPKKFLVSEIEKCLSFDRLKVKSEQNRPFCLFYAGLTSIKLNIMQLNNVENLFVPQACQLSFEARSSEPIFTDTTVKMPFSMSDSTNSTTMDILSSPLDTFTSAYCFVKNTDNTSTWSLTVIDKKHLQRLADGMHSALGDSNWNERLGPILRIHLIQDVNGILSIFPRMYPFTKSITELSLSGDLNDKGALIMKNLSYYCPRLTSLLLTRNSSQPSIIMIKMFQLPKDLNLTNVSLYLPYDTELFNNLHHYQPIDNLRIYPDSRR